MRGRAHLEPTELRSSSFQIRGIAAGIFLSLAIEIDGLRGSCASLAAYECRMPNWRNCVGDVAAPTVACHISRLDETGAVTARHQLGRAMQRSLQKLSRSGNANSVIRNRGRSLLRHSDETTTASRRDRYRCERARARAILVKERTPRQAEHLGGSYEGESCAGDDLCEGMRKALIGR